MRENWYALTIAIVKQCDADQAFKFFYTGKLKRSADEMLRMKRSGMTYAEIGEACGLSADTIYRYLKKKVG